MLKKILAVVVLAALTYTAYTILQCTVMDPKSTSASKPRPVKASSMLANAYHKNIKLQQSTKQELDTMATLDAYSPEKSAMKYLGAQGMLQMLASKPRARASK